MKYTNNLAANLKENRDVVLTYLRELEEENGGYYSTDLALLSKKLGVKKSGLKKMLVKWLKEDSAFSGMHYLGRHKPSTTPSEFIYKEIDLEMYPWIGALIGGIIGLFVALRMGNIVVFEWLAVLNLIIIFAVGGAITGQKGFSFDDVFDNHAYYLPAIMLFIFFCGLIGGINGYTSGLFMNDMKGDIGIAIFVGIGGAFLGFDIWVFYWAINIISGRIDDRIGGTKGGMIAGGVIGTVVGAAFGYNSDSASLQSVGIIIGMIIGLIVGVIRGGYGIAILGAIGGGIYGIITEMDINVSFIPLITNIPIFIILLFAIIGYYGGIILKSYFGRKWYKPSTTQNKYIVKKSIWELMPWEALKWPFIIAFIVLGNYISSIPSEVKLDADDNGRLIELRKVIYAGEWEYDDERGDFLVITLEADPTSGYIWEVTELNTQILHQVETSDFLFYRLQRLIKPESNLSSAKGMQTLRFESVIKGMTPLKLAYRRPGINEPLKTFSLQVVVR